MPAPERAFALLFAAGMLGCSGHFVGLAGETGFRAVLDIASAESLEAGGVELVAFERRTIEPFGVQTHYLEVAEKKAPEALLPLAVLYDEAYERYQLAGDLAGAVRSRELARAAAERYARQTGADASPTRRRLAAQLLTSVGGRFEEASRSLSASALFARAVALDPTVPWARLAAALDRERRGEYEQTLELLAGLRAAEPAHREAQLHYAVNLVRLGRSAEGVALLEGLVRDDGSWVGAVACGELARQDPDRSRALIGECLERWPGEPSLAVLAALSPSFPEPVGTSLDALFSAASGGDPARSRYHRMPVEELASLREGLARAASERRSALRGLLGPRPGPR